MLDQDERKLHVDKLVFDKLDWIWMEFDSMKRKIYSFPFSVKYQY